MGGGYGISCGYVSGGQIQMVSGVKGCVQKRRSPTGDELTWETEIPVPVAPGQKPRIEKKSYTMALVKENGRVVGTSMAEGDNLKTARQVTTTKYNLDASSLNNSLIETRVTQREAGKEDRFLIYDRNLCARFREAGDLNGDLMKLNTCATVLPKFEDAALEWNNKLQAQNTRLAVGAYDMASQRLVYKPARTGAITDLIAIASACAQMSPNPSVGGSGSYGTPPSLPEEHDVPATRERPAGYRDAADKKN